MRTTADRIRHTLLFEAIAIVVMSAVGTFLLERSAVEFGALSVMMSLLAMSWNYLFNLLFDKWDHRFRKARPRGVGLRVVHACLYEAGMLSAGSLLIAWWLRMTLLDAFVLGVGFAGFFLVYAFAYNWAYDVVFPVANDDEHNDDRHNDKSNDERSTPPAR